MMVQPHIRPGMDTRPNQTQGMNAAPDNPRKDASTKQY
jgi:hypothetical protein